MNRELLRMWLIWAEEQIADVHEDIITELEHRIAFDDHIVGDEGMSYLFSILAS